MPSQNLHHTERLYREVDQLQGQPQNGLLIWGFVLALLMPILGFVIGIVLMAKNRIGPGLAVWGTCLVGWLLWISVLLGGVATASAHEFSPSALHDTENYSHHLPPQRWLRHAEDNALHYWRSKGYRVHNVRQTVGHKRGGIWAYTAFKGTFQDRSFKLVGFLPRRMRYRIWWNASVSDWVDDGYRGVCKIMLHEYGHVAGWIDHKGKDRDWFHSDDPHSLMYPAQMSNQPAFGCKWRSGWGDVDYFKRWTYTSE